MLLVFAREGRQARGTKPLPEDPQRLENATHARAATLNGPQKHPKGRLFEASDCDDIAQEGDTAGLGVGERGVGEFIEHTFALLASQRPGRISTKRPAKCAEFVCEADVKNAALSHINVSSFLLYLSFKKG